MAGPLDSDIQVAAASPPPRLDDELSEKEQATEILIWFHQNFEDGQLHTPYDSEDGEYKYIWGGPYHINDIFAEAFPQGLSDSVLDEVVSSLNDELDNWVVHENRISGPDDEDEFRAPVGTDYPEKSLDEAHADMLRRVEAVERTLAEIELARGGMGHNRPPEVIDDEPLNEVERREMGEALAVLKLQPVVPASRDSQLLNRVYQTLTAAASKTLSWLAKQANSFVDEAVKKAGGAAGVAGVGLVSWTVLGDQLQALVGAVGRWLVTINPPF